MATPIDLARGWLQKGDSDRANADRTARSTGPYDTACFHAQQAVEKYLKAVLALAGSPIPRTHDLEDIYNYCVAVEPALQLDRMELSALTPYASNLAFLSHGAHFYLLYFGVRKLGVSFGPLLATRRMSSLSPLLPGTITASVSRSADSLRSNRRSALRAFASGPWQGKQFSEKIGKMSRPKWTGSGSPACAAGGTGRWRARPTADNRRSHMP